MEMDTECCYRSNSSYAIISANSFWIEGVAVTLVGIKSFCLAFIDHLLKGCLSGWRPRHFWQSPICHSPQHALLTKRLS